MAAPMTKVLQNVFVTVRLDYFRLLCHSKTLVRYSGKYGCFRIPNVFTSMRPFSSRFSKAQSVTSKSLFPESKTKLKSSTLDLPCYGQSYVTNAESLKKCWKCGKMIDTEINQRFCECGLIQSPEPALNHFKVLGTDETFEMDTEMLTKTFRELQKHLHPDKYSIKSEQEQEFAALHSMMVNKAYQTLLNPLSRAIYLLQMHGMSIEERDITLDPQFLMQILEVNEELSATQDVDAINAIGSKNDEILSGLLQDLSTAFSNKDISHAKVLLARLKYHANISDKVKEKLRESL